MAKIELSEYIQGLRGEMQRAIESGVSANLRFFAEKIELEIEVGVEKSATGTGQVSFRFFVFDAEIAGNSKVASTSKQTIRLTLLPGYKGQKDGVWVSAIGREVVG